VRRALAGQRVSTRSSATAANSVPAGRTAAGDTAAFIGSGCGAHGSDRKDPGVAAGANASSSPRDLEQRSAGLNPELRGGPLLSAVEPVNPPGGLGGDQRGEVAAPGSAVAAVTAVPPTTL